MYHLLIALLQPYPLFLLLSFAALARAWPIRREARGTPLLVAAMAGLLAISTPAIAYLAIGSLEWQYAPQNDLPTSAEAIVVLSGYALPADSARPEAQLGYDSIYRCLHAARLYRQRPCPVFVCGGLVDPSARMPPLAHQMRDFLVQLGVRPTDLVVEDRSTTTYENARECQRLLQRRRLGHIVLVTEALHMPRAARSFHACGIELTPSGCDYKASQFEWSVSSLLPSPDAAGGLQEAVHEWLGLGWYALRGRI
jgi:uncharacterized SAM-binding protein YcdF (DUF218 family)